MPNFAPFRGIHYDTERFGTDLSRLAAPPYDVIDEDRLAHLRSVDEHNAVHLTLPEGGDRGEEDDRYERAGALFRSWLGEGVLVATGGPSLYLYRVEFEDEDGRGGRPRRMTGVIGALDLSPPGEGGALAHERTMSKPKGDRLDLLRATRANLEPIWGLSLTAGLSELLEPGGAPLVECTDTRGYRHRLHALSDPGRIEAVADAIASSPVVIADGHHRYETSLHYQGERRAADPGADRIMTMVVELAEDQLAVQPIHRLVTGLPSPGVLREALEDAFDLVPAGPNEPEVVAALGARMAAEGAMTLVEPDAVTLLVPRGPDAEAAADEVDAVRFESAVAPALAACGAEVTYRHDRAVVAGQVRKGTAGAAVLLRPVLVPTIRAVAERGERMPQKTTFFTPKPSTGLVFRSLDEG